MVGDMKEIINDQLQKDNHKNVKSALLDQGCSNLVWSRLAGIPEALRPGPLARTLLASWAGSTLILKGLERQKG